MMRQPCKTCQRANIQLRLEWHERRSFRQVTGSFCLCPAKAAASGGMNAVDDQKVCRTEGMRLAMPPCSKDQGQKYERHKNLAAFR